jgi:hypothetical protein
MSRSRNFPGGHRGRPYVAVVCMAWLAGCGRAEWREADARLNEAAQAARADGFSPMSGPHNTFGTFKDSGTVKWRVHLEAHESYFIAAGCTTACESLHFDIREPHGEMVATDTATGPSPRVAFTPPEEGDFQILIHHGRCTGDECRFVAQVYSKAIP